MVYGPPRNERAKDSPRLRSIAGRAQTDLKNPNVNDGKPACQADVGHATEGIRKGQKKSP